MLRIAICDDEEYFRMREKQLIEKYMKEQGHDCRMDLYTDGRELLEVPEGVSSYDVIFLDINMEKMDGLETAGKIRELSAAVSIVFVTAYITYALEGYKVDAVRYLLKEDSSLESAFRECLDTIMNRMGRKEAVYETDAPNRGKRIPVDSILYVESRLHKVIFFVDKGEIKEYSKYDRLDTVEKSLRQYGFFRVHQSFLVNMRYVKNVSRYKVLLENGTEVSISKKYYKSVETEYIRQQGGI
ncbi:MAG: LytTR family DNA-binding domain-containing protein [Roseburia sp.]|nr:LytTR family DNA-binding domain-containing protein [Roseburia sp.]